MDFFYVVCVLCQIPFYISRIQNNFPDVTLNAPTKYAPSRGVSVEVH